MFFNDYYDGWYVLVLFLLFLPLYWAFGYFFLYMMAEKKEEREKLQLGIVFAIITVVLVTIWSIIYISSFYKYGSVYHGVGDADDQDNYKKETKKAYITNTIIIGLIMTSLLVYFWFACRSWAQIARS